MVTRYSTFDIYGQIGVRHAFHVLWHQNCECEVLTIDSTTWSTTTWDPFARWQTPFIPEYSEETAFLETDVPGYSNARTLYTSMGIQGYDNVNRLIPCVLGVTNANPIRWAHHGISCTSVELWTSQP
jgi:hypothetical protein